MVLYRGVLRALTPTDTPSSQQRSRRPLARPLGLFATGQVTPLIDRTYPLDEAADSLRYVAAGHTRGKAVVTD